MSRQLVHRDHVFVFEHDFESAIPPDLLWEALLTIEVVEAIDHQDFITAVASDSSSIVKRLKRGLDLDLESVKVPLAEAVADILNATIQSGVKPWCGDQSFMTTEFGRFLDFLRQIR